jgi:hypothetical protein
VGGLDDELFGEMLKRLDHISVVMLRYTQRHRQQRFTESMP